MYFPSASTLPSSLPPPRSPAFAPDLFWNSLRNDGRAGSHVCQWEKSWAKDVFFGVNMLHERRGVLRVGDEVEVLRVAKNFARAIKMD